MDDGRLWAEEPPLDQHGWRRSQLIYHHSIPYSLVTSRGTRLEPVFQALVNACQFLVDIYPVPLSWWGREYETPGR